MIRQLNPYEIFPGSVIVFGPAAKAAALHINRCLGGEGHVFRHTQRGGEQRLHAVIELGLGQPIGWTRELLWSGLHHYRHVVQAISRDRARIIGQWGDRLPRDEQVTYQMLRGRMWVSAT